LGLWISAFDFPESAFTFELMSHAPEPRIPLLPTLMTAGNILCGYVAILQIFDGRHYEVNMHYHYAILFILLACLFDALDGRVARMGGTESPFGRELDSLADIVSFGVAPALLVHDIVLKEIDMQGLGWMISCIYLVCGAMRLARFNCLAAADVKSSSKSFRGCPIPAAAGVISSLTLLIIWLDSNEREIGNWKYVLAGLMVLLSYLMVSDLEYPSFKAVNWRTKRSFHWVIISIVVIAFTVMNWHWMPSIIFVSYLLYGLVRPWVSRRWRQEIEIEAESLDLDVDAETLALNGEQADLSPRATDPATQI
jgi:CDP-diacylglycerol--serine O-phosphatidyltransferase